MEVCYLFFREIRYCYDLFSFELFWCVQMGYLCAGLFYAEWSEVYGKLICWFFCFGKWFCFEDRSYMYFYLHEFFPGCHNLFQVCYLIFFSVIFMYRNLLKGFQVFLRVWFILSIELLLRGRGSCFRSIERISGCILYVIIILIRIVIVFVLACMLWILAWKMTYLQVEFWKLVVAGCCMILVS